MSLQDLFVIDVYAFFMVFTRLGAAFVFLVGFASSTVSVNIRLAMALLISLVITPLVSPLLPPLPLLPLPPLPLPLPLPLTQSTTM